MKLGAFSISLSVKDLNKSIEFYEKLGFTKLAGDLSQNFIILKNGETVIGLFQGMFNGNILTFNPGWDQNGKETDPFLDIREIHKKLSDEGIDPSSDFKDNPNGPGSFMISDPDGNVILIDQHR